MVYQVISVAVGKKKEDILKKYPKIYNNYPVKANEQELFVEMETIKDFASTIKQNVIVCHDENVIHIYDQKLR